MRFSRFLLLLPILWVAACAGTRSPAPVSGNGGTSSSPSAHSRSAEISVYDEWVSKHPPRETLVKCREMADEPYILGGEDAESLTLQVLSLLKQLGDAGFAEELERLPPRDRSAVSLFLTRSDLSDDHPLTLKTFQTTPKIEDFPALLAERREEERTGSAIFDREPW